MFSAQAVSVSATVARVDKAADAPGEIAKYLRGHNLPPQVRRGKDERLESLNWQSAGIDNSIGPSSGDDLTSVSFAEGAIAETGTLALVSGPHNPTTLNFLPMTTSYWLMRKPFWRRMKMCLRKLRERFGPGVMPRTSIS